MPQVESIRHHSTKPLIAAIVGGLAVVAMVGVVVVMLVMQQRSQATDAYAAATKAADNDLRYQRYDRAIADYTVYLETKPTTDRVYKVQVYLAQAYEQKGDFKEALKWFQAAEKMGSTLDLIVKPGIGEVARELGQSDVSIKAYKEAIVLEQKSDSPLSGQTIQEYQASITSQGGSL